jgi:hypothetical protein
MQKRRKQSKRYSSKTTKRNDINAQSTKATKKSIFASFSCLITRFHCWTLGDNNRKTAVENTPKKQIEQDSN